MRTVYASFVCGLLAFTSSGFAQSSDYLFPRSNMVPAARRTTRARTSLVVAAKPKVRPWHMDAVPAFGPRTLSLPGLYPADLAKAYGFPNSASQGSGAIAIIDAYDYGNGLSDFNTFSSVFGLPTEVSTNPTASTNKVFQVIYQGGSKPLDSSITGWDTEESKNIEWAHAMAPKAKIYLIEAQSEYLTDMLSAVQMAANMPDVRQISMSWGFDESSDQLTVDSTLFSQISNAVCFGSAGNDGGYLIYPAVSPYVVCVGGTRLDFDYAGNFLDEVAWGDGSTFGFGSGGGKSLVEPRPAYQDKLQSIIGPMRGGPDMTADGDPDSGVAVFCSPEGGWIEVGGTGISSPIVAAIENARGSVNANTTAELTETYTHYRGGPFFRDIISGNTGFAAKRGWDFASGIGSPVGVFTKTTFPLTVQSANPSSAVSIAISDTQNSPNGSTPFSKTYTASAQMTLTAPVNAPNGYLFTFWSLDSVKQPFGKLDLSLVMSAAHTAVANYAQTNLVLQSLRLTPTTLYGGQPASGTVAINGAAGTNGVTVSLSSSDPTHVRVPRTVDIRSGTTRVTFPISTSLIFETGSANIMAAVDGSTKTATLTLQPSTISLSLSPTQVTGGLTSTLSLNVSPAPTADVSVPVTATNIGVLKGFPGSVNVASGQTVGKTVVQTNAVQSGQEVDFSVPGSSATASLEVVTGPPSFAGISSLSSNPLFGGNYCTLLVSLTQPAPNAITVAVRHTVSTLQIPTSVTIATGHQVGTLRFPTPGVASTISSTITATYGKKSSSVVLQIVAAPLINLTLHPVSVVGGTAAQGQAYIEGLAPSGGATIGLVSSNTNLVSVPPYVVIPANQRNATFPVTTFQTVKTGNVTITASYRGKTLAKILTVTP